MPSQADIPDAAHFADRFRRLLPPGEAWEWAGAGNGLLLGFSRQQVRFRDFIRQILLGFIPHTTVDLLPEWLESVSLPNACAFENLAGSDVLNVLEASQFESFSDFQSVFNESIVVEKFVSRAGATQAGSELVNDESWWSAWVLKVPESVSPGIVFAIADEAVAGDYVEKVRDDDNYACRVLSLVPAHQKVYINRILGE